MMSFSVYPLLRRYILVPPFVLEQLTFELKASEIHSCVLKMLVWFIDIGEEDGGTNIWRTIANSCTACLFIFWNFLVAFRSLGL